MKLLTTILLLIATNLVFASGDNQGPPGPAGPPGPQGPPGIDGIDATGGGAGTTSTETPLVLSSDNAGVASAIAAGQCQFDWTHSWQGCAAFGTFDSNSAAAFGLGKRYDEILFNGTVSIEEGELGIGASANWKF